MYITLSSLSFVFCFVFLFFPSDEKLSGCGDMGRIGLGKGSQERNVMTVKNTKRKWAPFCFAVYQCFFTSPFILLLVLFYWKRGHFLVICSRYFPQYFLYFFSSSFFLKTSKGFAIGMTSDRQHEERRISGNVTRFNSCFPSFSFWLKAESQQQEEWGFSFFLFSFFFLIFLFQTNVFCSIPVLYNSVLYIQTLIPQLLHNVF